MAVTFTSLAQILDHGFDTIIDVRSPAEFAVDHVPGAINLPALSNAQRAEVGTIYKQISPFDARKIGAALVARNVADHLQGPLAQMDGGWRPLVYCWRGGQRSGSFASILTQIGWRADTMADGYQGFRRLVNSAIYDDPLPHRFILLDGNTGTAKTAILARLAAQNVQVLDLEGLAGHRGSSLGALPAGQPAQKGFETALVSALQRHNPARPVLVEAESNKIGRLNLPPSLWNAMQTAPRIVIKAPLEHRATYLLDAYKDITTHPDQIAKRLDPLRYVRGHAVVDSWLSLLHAGDFANLARALVIDHYDPAYARTRRLDQRNVLDVVQAKTLDEAGQTDAAEAIKAIITAF